MNSMRISLAIRLLAAIAVLTIMTQACGKDPVEAKGDTAIRGTVTDPGTSAAIESVEVWIDPPGTTMVYTNAQGEYYIGGLAPGTYEVCVMRPYCEIKRRSLTVNKEQTRAANFAIDAVVDEGQFEFRGMFRWHHYYISKGLYTWPDARSVSLSQGGHLVTIADAEENAVVWEMAASIPANVLLGLTDQVAEGTWVWVTGEPYEYTNWRPNEPNNSGNEDFGSMLYTDGMWNDYNGTGGFFILELE